MFDVIFSVVLFLLIILFSGLGLLMGRRYRWYYSLTKLIITAVTAVGSFFLSKVIAKPIAEFAYEKLTALLPESIMAYINEAPSAPLVVSAVITVILAPVIFIPLFLILRAILNIIAKIICKAIAKKQLINVAPEASDSTVVEQTEVAATEASEGETVIEEITTTTVTKKEKKAKKPKKVRPLRAKGANPAGMACGFVCGLLLFITLSVPFLGFFTLVNDATSTVSGILPENPTITKIVEVSDSSVNNPISKVLSKLYGNKLFEGLTTTKVGEHKLSLTKEIHLLTTVANAVLSLNDEETTPEGLAEKIREIGTAFEDSSVIPTIAPELFASANESWEKGEDFHGIKKIESESIQPMIDPLINTLATSNYDSIKQDAKTLIEIIAILAENDVIETAKSNPTGIMENEDMTSSIIYNLLKNEHFSPVVEGVAKVGIQYLGSALHFHAHADDLYNEFLTEADETITPAFVERSDVRARLATLFDNYGLDVSVESIDNIANKLDATNVTTVLKTEPIKLNNGKVITLNAPGILLENSAIICVDQIELHIDDVDDAETESKALAKAMHEVMSITSIIGSGSLSDANSIQKIGPILDALSSTKMIGADSTEKIIVGIFQSDLVHGTMGFTLIDATDVAHTICDKSHDHGYAPLLKSVADTIEVVQIITDPDTNKEDFHEKVGALIKDLTPETTEVLQKVTTKEVIEKKGVSPQSSKHVSELISNVLGNLSNAQVAGMDDAQYKKEAAATSNLLNAALSASISGKTNIFADSVSSENGETGSAINMTASEYVNSVLDSDVISSTIVETVYADKDTPAENPLNLSKGLSEKDHENVMNAIEDHWDNSTKEEKEDPEVIKKYTAVGYIINIPLEVVDGNLVPVSKA